MRGKQPRNEQGSALVMALVMLTLIGLLVGAALNYSDTSLRASNNNIRPNHASLYAADSAIQGAIEYIRDNPEMSSDVLGSGCLPAFYRYTDPKVGDVTVDACPQDDSLIYEGAFRAVLLTLGQTDDDGIFLAHNGNVDVGGHVWSNSHLDLNNPTHMVMNGGRVWAWGSCNRPANILMPAGVTPDLQRQHELAVRWGQAQGRARPGRSLARPRRRLAAGGRARVLDPADVPRVRVEQDDVATRRLLQRRRALQHDELVRRRHAEPGRLLPELPGRRRHLGPREERDRRVRCERSGRRARVRRLGPHQAVGHADDSVRPERDTQRAADRSVRPEDGNRPERSVHDHTATVRACDADHRHVLECRDVGQRRPCSRAGRLPAGRTERDGDGHRQQHDFGADDRLLRSDDRSGAHHQGDRELGRRQGGARRDRRRQLPERDRTQVGLVHRSALAEPVIDGHGVYVGQPRILTDELRLRPDTPAWSGT